MRWILILGVMPLLAACSQQQQCVSRATKDLRVVQRFVKEAEGNLARGYALVKVEKIDYEREACGKRKDGSVYYCRVPHTVTRTVPKAIDLDAEAAKLASLNAKRSVLTAQANADIAMCKQTYPEA